MNNITKLSDAERACLNMCQERKTYELTKFLSFEEIKKLTISQSFISRKDISKYSKELSDPRMYIKLNKNLTKPWSALLVTRRYQVDP